MVLTKFMGRRRSHGASLLSYGLVVGLISVVALSAVTSSGESVDGLFTDVSDTLSGVVTDTGGAASPAASSTPSGPVTCQSLFDGGVTSSGPQTIDLPSGGTTTLYCDMSDGGGWSLVGKIGINRSGHFSTASLNIGDLASDSLGVNDEAKLSDSDIRALAVDEYRMTCRSSTMKVNSTSCSFVSTARADSTGCAVGGTGDAPSIEYGVADAVTDISWHLGSSASSGCEVGGDRDSGTLWVR